MNEQPEPIRAKVAQILNSTDLVLNKGALDHVEEGMKFAVLNDKGFDIRDPDTHEVLDSVEVAKTLVKIVRVTARVSVGRTFRTKGGGWGALDSVASVLGSSRERTETLRAGDRSAQADLDAKDAKVTIGDEALQYFGEFSGLAYDF